MNAMFFVLFAVSFVSNGVSSIYSICISHLHPYGRQKNPKPKPKAIHITHTEREWEVCRSLYLCAIHVAEAVCSQHTASVSVRTCVCVYNMVLCVKVFVCVRVFFLKSLFRLPFWMYYKRSKRDFLFCFSFSQANLKPTLFFPTSSSSFGELELPFTVNLPKRFRIEENKKTYTVHWIELELFSFRELLSNSKWTNQFTFDVLSNGIS